MGVLSARMYVYHALAWCPWRPEGVHQMPGLELQTLASCRPCGFWDPTPDSSEEQAVLLIDELSPCLFIDFSL